MDPEEEKKDGRILEGTCRQLRLLQEKSVRSASESATDEQKPFASLLCALQAPKKLNR
jgi:hypothetical protein